MDGANIPSFSCSHSTLIPLIDIFSNLLFSPFGSSLRLHFPSFVPTPSTQQLTCSTVALRNPEKSWVSETAQRLYIASTYWYCNYG